MQNCWFASENNVDYLVGSWWWWWSWITEVEVVQVVIEIEISCILVIQQSST